MANLQAPQSVSKRHSHSEPRPGDLVLFFRPHRFFDYLIQLFTLSRYYHVALYDGDDHVIEARPQGVVRNSLQSRAGGYDFAPAPDDKGEEALKWAKSQLGAGFDHMNLLVIVLEHLFIQVRLNITPHDKYSCGELVATAFDKAGIRLFPDRDLDDIEPKDFAKYLPRS